MSGDFDIDDVGQIRREGDLREFLRSRCQRSAGKDELQGVALQGSSPTGKLAGSWPEGCGRPGSPIPYRPGEGWPPYSGLAAVA